MSFLQREAVSTITASFPPLQNLVEEVTSSFDASTSLDCTHASESVLDSYVCTSGIHPTYLDRISGQSDSTQKPSSANDIAQLVLYHS